MKIKNSAIFLGCILLYQITFASIGVKIFMKDEGFTETNIIKPRIYIQNTGTEDISNFTYYFYFTADSGKVPIVENYYIPNSTVTLENLGSNNYRVKYNFAAFILKAGTIAPDVNGNDIGIHWSDWSTVNKSKAFSYIASVTFVEDTKIPVYSSTGTLLYGSDPGTGNIVPPIIPPVSIGNPPLLSQYVLYGTGQCIVSDRVIVRGGTVGSKGYTEVGCDAVVNGTLSGAGNALLRDRARINGDVTLGGTLSQQNQIVITGTVTQNSTLVSPAIATKATIPVGSQDITVPNNGSLNLAPGNYNNVHVYSNASITLNAGTYNLRSFILEPDVHLVLSTAQENITEVDVSDLISFGDRTKMQFSGNAYALNVRFYSNQQAQFRTGTDAKIYGIYTMPYAGIDIPSRTVLVGEVYGQQITIEPDDTICRPATLTDLWNSALVFSPVFDQNTLNYTAIVASTMPQITVAALAAAGATVTINGQPSPAIISLQNAQTIIGIDASNNAQCGGTHYTLTIKKQSDYMVYVNSSSGAPASQCDGTSWYKAYKDLQQGMDSAAKYGRQVWVAEGVYKPVKRTDTSDSRSATFYIQPGQLLIGAFNGTETDSTPKGSPYNTILSGDILGNDATISSWPPVSSSDLAKLTDNVYHVVTMNGAQGASCLKLKGFKITGGVADKTGALGIGAGVYNVRCAPMLELCSLDHNYSISHGAGMYSGVAPKQLENCLFRLNYSKTGDGGGLYASSGPMTIDASVFDGNMANGDTTSMGGALYALQINGSAINSVFTGNASTGDGGAIFVDSSVFSVKNCTFFANSSTNKTGGISNARHSTDTIINAILWQDKGISSACKGTGVCYSELNGNGLIVSYSCITNGFAGIGNILNDPKFLNAASPSGSDNTWGTLDDGLRINYNSPCIGKGTATPLFTNDIINFLRKSPDDIGAYIAAIADTGASSWGRIDGSGNYYPLSDMQVMKSATTNSLNWLAASRAARVYELKYSPNKALGDSFVINIFGTDKNGNALSQSKMIAISLYRVKIESNLWTYRSVRINANGSVDGKMTVFVNDPLIQGIYQNCYVIYCGFSGNTTSTVFYSQF